MITYIQNGDIFESSAQILVNPVNTVGVMGKGLALEFKKRYPDMFKTYKKICDEKEIEPGRLYICLGKNHLILLFPTKEHWKDSSKIEYIDDGLRTFCLELLPFLVEFAGRDIKSIAFPKLGCGNGGLDWEDVKPVMERWLNDLPIDVFIYV